MDSGFIDEVIEQYRILFQLDLGDFYDDLEEVGSQLCDDEDESSEEFIAKLRKEILKKISEIPTLAQQVSEVLSDFDQQVQENTHDYHHYRSDDPMEQDQVEFMYDVKGWWGNMPHNLVAENWDLIKKAAKKFHHRQKADDDLEFNDLVSAGHEALYTAARKMYEGGDNKNFRNFAWKILKDKMQDQQGKKHPVPFNTRKKLEKLYNARVDLSCWDNGDESILKLSEVLNLSEGEMRALMEVEAIWGAGLEIKTDVVLEELEIPDLSPDALTLMITQETNDKISEALTSLTAMQKAMIESIYFKDLTFREAAEKLEISMNRAKKTHKKAMLKLKIAFDEDA